MLAAETPGSDAVGLAGEEGSIFSPTLQKYFTVLYQFCARLMQMHSF